MKVLLVGCGEHATENLIPSLAQIPQIEVVAASDPNASALRSAGRWFVGADLYTSEKVALERIYDVDAVVVAATPQVHYKFAKAALELGKPIFLEKPPTVTTGELRELSAKANEASLVTCVGHNLRHTEAAIEFRDAVSSPAFGNPVAMEMRYFASKPRGKRWSLESALRSFLLSHANHAIDLMIYQMGPIRQVVAARAWPDVHGGIAITVQFIFESGAIGNLIATSYAPHFNVAASVLSNSGSVAEMHNLYDVRHTRRDMGKRHYQGWLPRTLETGYRFAGYQTELERFFIAIQNNRPEDVHPSFSEEVAIYEAMDQIESSIVDSGD